MKNKDKEMEKKNDDLLHVLLHFGQQYEKEEKHTKYTNKKDNVVGNRKRVLVDNQYHKIK